MLHEADILNRVPELLAELSGMQPRRLPSSDTADLVLALGAVTLVVEAKTSSQAGPMAAAAEQASGAAQRYGPSALGVVVAPYIGELGQAICREAGVGHLDLSGNVHIHVPPLLLHVEGKPNRFPRRGRPSSVFAPKSSRVVRLLLLDPQRWWKQKDLVFEGDLGAGYVSRICRRLEEDQLIHRNDRGQLRPRNPDLLLDAWINHYEFSRHDITRGHIAARNGQELMERVADTMAKRKERYAVTGLAAAWALAPFANYRLMSTYVQRSPSDDLLNQLKCRVGESGANLWLVKPNDDGVFHGAQVIEGVSCVSPVQAYVDLQSMPERSEEAAQHLREERLRWQ